MRTHFLQGSLLCIVLAAGSLVVTNANAESSLALFSRLCGSLPPSPHKIAECTKLLNTGKVLDSEIFFELAHTYSRLGNDDEAIRYAKLHRDDLISYFRKHPHNTLPANSDPRFAEVYKQFPSIKISFGHEIIGNFEVIKSLKLSLAGDTEGSLAAAKSALGTYTQAIAVNPRNHSAYASRAEIFARYCENSKARVDYERAISIARQRDSEDAARKYQEELSEVYGKCWNEFKGKLN